MTFARRWQKYQTKQQERQEKKRRREQIKVAHEMAAARGRGVYLDQHPEKTEEAKGWGWDV